MQLLEYSDNTLGQIALPSENLPLKNNKWYMPSLLIISANQTKKNLNNKNSRHVSPELQLTRWNCHQISPTILSIQFTMTGTVAYLHIQKAI